jgi:hypothetical protein
MSLLTEKQIAEIIDMATQQAEFAEILKLKLDHWNDNQHSFNVNWNDAPAWADQATLQVRWNGIGHVYTIHLDTFERPITAHPHAAVIMKYAEVAAKRHNPWVEFEMKNAYGNWEEIKCSITFFEECEYRHIGDKS